MTKEKTKNSYVVDYTKKTVILKYEGERIIFDLNEGDVGDFWHSFTTKKGIVKDVNFYQEEPNVTPAFSVYGVKSKEGTLFIDTSDEDYIENFKQVGNQKDYFGAEYFK